MVLYTIFKAIGLVNVAKYFRDIYEKKSGVFYRTVKALRLDADKKHFESIYFSAVAKFEEKVPDVVKKLFSRTEIRDAFKAEFYDQKKSAVFPALDYLMQSQLDLQQYRYTLHDLIDEFSNLLIAAIRNSLSPQEQYQEKHFVHLKEGVDTVVETTSQIPEILEGQQEMKKEMQEMINTLNYLKTAASPRSYDGEIGRMLSLADDKDNFSAIKVYEQFRANEWDKLTNLQRYDICSAIGVAYIELGEHDKAAALFIELPKLDVSPKETFGLAALGYAIQNDKENAQKYITLARTEDPMSPHATQAAINLLDDGFTAEDLENAVPPGQLTNIMVGLEVAIRFNSWLPKHRDKARKILEDLFITYPNRDLGYHEIQSMLGNVLILQVRDNYFRSGKVLIAEDRQDLFRAIELLTNAWNYYKTTDLRQGKWYVLSNRGQAHRMLENWDEAARDLELSIDTLPTKTAYFALIENSREQNQPLGHIIKRTRAGVDLTRKDKEELDMLEVESLLRESKFPEALQKVDEFSQTENPNEHFLQLQTMKLYALEGMGRQEDANHYAQKMAEEHPDNPFVYTIAAEFAIKNKDYSLGKANLKMAVLTIDGHRHFRIIDKIVRLSDEVGEYENVKDLLDRPEIITRRSHWTSKLLHGLVVLDEYERAFEIAAPLYDPNNFDISITQALLIKYSHDGDLGKMEEIAGNGLTYDLENGFLHVKLLAALLGNNLIDDAMLHIASLPAQWRAPGKICELLFAVTRLHGSGYVNAVMECAYQMLFQEPNNDETLATYISFVKQLAHLGFDMDKEIIGNDCYIQLTTKDGKLLNVIIEDKKCSTKSHEISSPLGQLLINKRKGIIISIDGVSYMITDIFSKYVFPFYTPYYP